MASLVVKLVECTSNEETIARVNPASELRSSEETMTEISTKSDTPTPGPPSIADSSRAQNQEHSPGPQIEDPLFAEIDRETRERKATKSDGAEVPQFICWRNILYDGDFGWTMEDLPRLWHLIEACKTMMLHWWKRKVTSFFSMVPNSNGRVERLVHAISGLHRESKCGSTTGGYGNRRVRGISKRVSMQFLERPEPPGGSGKTDLVLFTGAGPTNTLKRSETVCQFISFESHLNTLEGRG
eukprot:scaffold99642_cov51-Attheya_sp.AAC.2